MTKVVQFGASRFLIERTQKIWGASSAIAHRAKGSFRFGGDLQFRARFGRPDSLAKLPWAQRRDRARAAIRRTTEMIDRGAPSIGA